MASIGVDSDDALFLYGSVIHDHHIYKSIWAPRAEVLSVQANRHNRFAVAIFKTDVIVGHMCREVSSILEFVKWPSNISCSCLVTIIDLKYSTSVCA